MTPEQQKFYDIIHTTDYKVVGEDVNYKVFTNDETKEVVLQFQETTSRTDWINNFDILPWPLRLCDKIVWTTRGYARAYRSAWSQPLSEFIAEALDHPGYKKVIRGWSLGSAMAKIAARHYVISKAKKQDGDILDELTTYGDVKCWVNPFTQYDKRISKCHEYGTINDLVTWCVPFFSRDRRCKVGDRFSFEKLLETDYWHTHYHEYDYSKFEDGESNE